MSQSLNSPSPADIPMVDTPQDTPVRPSTFAPHQTLTPEASHPQSMQPPTSSTNGSQSHAHSSNGLVPLYPQDTEATDRSFGEPGSKWNTRKWAEDAEKTIRGLKDADFTMGAFPDPLMRK